MEFNFADAETLNTAINASYDRSRVYSDLAKRCEAKLSNYIYANDKPEAIALLARLFMAARTLEAHGVAFAAECNTFWGFSGMQAVQALPKLLISYRLLQNCEAKYRELSGIREDALNLDVSAQRTAEGK